MIGSLSVYLLDSNVLCELRPGKPHPSPQVRAWASAIAQSRVFLSAITILELEDAIVRLERRAPPGGGGAGQDQALRRWASDVRKAFKGRILACGEREALLCAPMHVPDPKGRRDSMIAATALSHGFVVVTRNVGDFESIDGLQLLNPWDHEAP